MSHTPSYQIIINGRDITPKIEPRLISLTLTEERGQRADQLDITLDDTDQRVPVPPAGARIALAIGFGDELVNKGEFVVDEVEHTGAPDCLQIKARAADMRQTLRQRAERSYHNTTLGDVVADIAQRNQLKASISPELAAQKIDHEDQTNESDLNFLTRISQPFDAVASIKKGTLIFLQTQGSKNAKGQAMPPTTITRADGDQHRYHSADRNAYTGVSADWQDLQNRKRATVVVGDESNAKVLAKVYSTEQDARNAAQAEQARIQRGAATLELTLAIGRPRLQPQTPLNVLGFKPAIDGTDWLVKKVTHTLGDGGYTTRVEAERRLEIDINAKNEGDDLSTMGEDE